MVYPIKIQTTGPYTFGVRRWIVDNATNSEFGGVDDLAGSGYDNTGTTNRWDGMGLKWVAFLSLQGFIASNFVVVKVVIVWIVFF